MEVAGIDVPCLGEGCSDWSKSLPESYLKYRTAFEQDLNIDNANVKQVIEGDDPATPDDSSLEKPRSFLDDFPLVLDVPEDDESPF